MRESILNQFLRLQSKPLLQELSHDCVKVTITAAETYLRSLLAHLYCIKNTNPRRSNTMIATQPTTKNPFLTTLCKMKFNKFYLINDITIKDLKKMKHQSAVVWDRAVWKSMSVYNFVGKSKQYELLAYHEITENEFGECEDRWHNDDIWHKVNCQWRLKYEAP